MSSVTVNQHTVAQGYLRKFADAKEKLWGFRKKDRAVFPATVRNVAGERFFYDLPPDQAPGGDPQAIEKLLARTIDAAFPSAITELTDGVERGQGIAPDLQERLARFIAIQLMRTRAARNMQTQTFDLLVAELRRRFQQAGGGAPDSAQPDGPDLRLSERDAAAIQARFFLDPGAQARFVGVLCNHIWVLGVNKTRKSFYTSDSPVARRPALGWGGLASLGIEIAFPLDPQHVLMLYERTYFSRLARFDRKAVEFNEPDIDHCNLLQLAESTRQVYCSVDDFDLARHVCAKHPELCDPDRIDVEIVTPGRPPSTY